MKIGINEILSGIEYTAINKITKELERDGFVVENMAHIKENGKKCVFDLYAEKGEEKRIYELKIGKNKIQKKRFFALQEEAKRLSAKLYIVYLEIPRSKEIEFNELDQIIYEDIINDLPSEIDSLSTHTTIESVDNIEIDTIEITNGIAKVTGAGTINLHLQFGSKTDFKNDAGLEDIDTVDFFFKLSVNLANNEVIKHYYKIDIEG